MKTAMRVKITAVIALMQQTKQIHNAETCVATARSDQAGPTIAVTTWSTKMKNATKDQIIAIPL